VGWFYKKLGVQYWKMLLRSGLLLFAGLHGGKKSLADIFHQFNLSKRFIPVSEKLKLFPYPVQLAHPPKLGEI